MPPQTGYSEAFISWVSACVGFAGAIAGSILTVALIEFQKWRARPILKLEFEPSERYLTSATYLSDKDLVDSRYLRVGLINEGKSVAQNCRIYLHSIQLVSAGKAGPDRLYDARQLSWPPNYQFDARTLPRNLRQIVNVVSMVVGDPRWRFQVEFKYGIDENVTEYAGTLRFGIIATADNAEPVTMYLLANLKSSKDGFDSSKE